MVIYVSFSSAESVEEIFPSEYELESEETEIILIVLQVSLSIVRRIKFRANMSKPPLRDYSYLHILRFHDSLAKYLYHIYLIGASDFKFLPFIWILFI